MSDDHTPAGGPQNLVVLFIITVADCRRTQAFWPVCSVCLVSKWLCSHILPLWL